VRVISGFGLVSMERSSSKLLCQPYDETFELGSQTDDEINTSNSTPKLPKDRISKICMDDLRRRNERITEFINKVKSIHANDHERDRFSSAHIPLAIPDISPEEKAAIGKVIQRLELSESIDLILSLFRIRSESKIAGLHRLFTLSASRKMK
jgi:hypothetical protein